MSLHPVNEKTKFAEQQLKTVCMSMCTYVNISERKYIKTLIVVIRGCEDLSFLPSFLDVYFEKDMFSLLTLISVLVN